MEQWQTKFAVGDVNILKGESNFNKWTMGVVAGAISDNDGIIPSARIRISKLTGALSQKLILPVDKQLLLLKNKNV